MGRICHRADSELQLHDGVGIALVMAAMTVIDPDVEAKKI